MRNSTVEMKTVINIAHFIVVSNGKSFSKLQHMKSFYNIFIFKLGQFEYLSMKSKSNRSKRIIFFYLICPHWLRVFYNILYTTLHSIFFFLIVWWGRVIILEVSRRGWHFNCTHHSKKTLIGSEKASSMITKKPHHFDIFS